ncbi:carbon-nitrogen hydrolase family protein [Streptomyces sp. NBC_00647]|uniref:carbon-nitrogen hydrolase family protein n=1 Tax=unclassified Streptomyces TaxID=2593676 RepID=UPI003255A70E
MRTALLQSSGRPGSIVENLKVLDEAAGRAAAAGAGLIVTSEMFLTGYAIGDDIARLAEPADGESADAIAEIATRHGVAVAYGYPEREAGRQEGEGSPADGGARVFNSAQLISADGTRLANYRKTHLFGCFEHDHFTPGDQPVVQAELNGLRVGLMICYDVEFPENVRAHALAGTDLLLVPTAQMHPFQFVAESVVPVRAFENQMYIAYVNRTGPEGEFEFVGLSTLAGPDGVARTRAGRGEELVLADADPVRLAASREANPYLKDRRPGLYGSLV